MNDYVIGEWEPEDDEPLHSHTTGRLLIEIDHRFEEGYVPKNGEWPWYATTIHIDGCAGWIFEGVGLNYWLEAYGVEFKKPGRYLIGNIEVTWSEDYYGDVDEDWSFDPPIETELEKLS